MSKRKQERSKNTYQKINTLFNRDVNNIIMPYEDFVDPAFEWLKDCKFECSEKVDGTNVRFEVSSMPKYENDELVGVSFSVEYKGKTDNAVIPKMLEDFMKTTYTPDVIFNGLGIKEFIPVSEFFEHNWLALDEKSKEAIPDINRVPKMYTIYGEGYGVKIQACGSQYLKDSNKVIGFDVKVTSNNGDELYLLNKNRDEIMNKMGMPIVPTIGYFTIQEAIDYVKRGFVSHVAENNKAFIAEGLVCKSPVGLKNRQGQRIIFKVKTCDWNKYFNRYGTYDKVDQKPNTLYCD